MRSEQMERQHLQGIAGEDRGRLVELPVAGRSAAAQVVVVHGRQVVVDERIAVDHFDGAGRGVHLPERQAEGFGGGVDQRRADALAGGEHAVALGGVQPLGHHGFGRQPGVQFALDALAPTLERLRQRLVGRCGGRRPGGTGRRNGRHSSPGSNGSGVAVADFCSRISTFCSACFERRLAVTRQCDAAFELLQRVLQREIAVLEPVNRGFEFGQRALEVRCRVGGVSRWFFGHGSGSPVGGKPPTGRRAGSTRLRSCASASAGSQQPSRPCRKSIRCLPLAWKGRHALGKGTGPTSSRPRPCVHLNRRLQWKWGRYPISPTVIG